jgi:hypothetical protein
MGMASPAQSASSRPSSPPVLASSSSSILARSMSAAISAPRCRSALLAAMAAIGCVGCSDDGGEDPPPLLLPQGPCPAGEVFYSGELVDWDSPSASVRGVNAATFTVEGEAARTDATSPNGRFELCLAKASPTKVTIDPTAASTYLGGTAVVELEVLAEKRASGDFVIPSLRSFTAMQELRFVPRVALGKAQVFVDVIGVERAVTLPATYEKAFAFDGTTWAEGTTGRAVFFTNVDAGADSRVTLPGTFVGGKTVPLTANQLTFVSVVGK